MAVVASVAHAEGTEPKNPKASTASRVYAATTLLNAADGGLISVGFSTLARMAPGARKFETLHSIKGDSLYRVATSEQGEVLATWEKDPSIHYFTRDGRHVVLPQPSSPREGINRFGVEFLGFLPSGREALVHMDGNEFGKSTQYDVTFRITLDGSKPPEPVVQMVSARQIDMNAQRAVYVLPKKAGQGCDSRSCDPVGEVVAFVFDENGNAQRKTLLNGAELSVTNAHMVRGQKDAPLILRVELQRNERVLARWRPGDAKAEVRPITRSSHGEPRFYALASGDVVETNVDYDEGLTITRHGVDGSRHVTAVPVLADPDNYDHHVHGIGVRKDGRLWMQWGDHLLFFGRNADAALRTHNIESLLTRRAEWAGVDVYVPSQDVLWVGIDSTRSRDFVRLDLADVDKRAKPFAQQKVARE
jgi:hypothetical protein